jgi:carbonic anhydrase/acetyltransferase-like protein (isoleucine patch superfamily)
MSDFVYVPAPDPGAVDPSDWRARKGRMVMRGKAFVALDAVVTGAVELGPDANIWFGCVLRGDDAPIRIGARTNIQDLSVVHADPGLPNEIGDDCVVGHRAVLHGARVANGCLIGMGAILLGGSKIGEGSIVAAGALVREGMEIPPRSLVVGLPGKVVRPVSEEALAEIRRNVAGYVQKARLYL